MRRFNQPKYDSFWGKLYERGELLRKAQRFSEFAIRGKLLESTSLRELKRVANQMK